MVRLVTSPVPATWFPGCAAGAPSQMCPVSPLGISSLTASLLADVSHPGSQEDLLRNWEPAHSLVEDAISGAEIAPRLLALAGVHLPLCLWQGEGLVRSWLALLWYSFNRFFCEQARLCFLWESSLFFPLSGYPTVWVSSHVSSLRLSSGHSDQVPTLSMQSTPPCSAPTCW